MNILFDFGGVLVDLNRQRCIDAFRTLDFDIQPYLGAYRQGGPFSLLEQGRITVPAFCDELRHLGVKPSTPDEAIVAAWEQYLMNVPTERLEMLLKIKQHYSVHVLSNTNEIHWAQACNDFFRYKGRTVNDFFDLQFLSYELHLEKPSPELYDYCIEQIGGKASDILFLDDCEVNCEAARQQGMQSVIAPAGSEWFKYFDENGKLLISSL